MQVTDEMAKEFQAISVSVRDVGGQPATATEYNRQRLQAWVDKFGLEPREADAEPDADDDAAVELHKILGSPMFTHQRIVEAALDQCFVFAEVYDDDAKALSSAICGMRALLAGLGVLAVKD